MSSTARILVVFSIYKTQWVGSIVEKVLACLETPPQGTENGQAKHTFPPYVFFHFPSRVLPSTWGGGLGSRGATHESPHTGESDVLTAAQLEKLHGLMRSDRIGLLPAGYSGAMHPLLHEDEILHDAEWGISNPWRSGFKDHFGNAQSVFIPFWPEVTRSRPHEGSGYAWWCEGISVSPGENRLVFSNPAGKRRVVDYVRVPQSSTAGQLTKLARGIGDTGSPVFFHLTADPEHIVQQLAALADTAFKHFDFTRDFDFLENGEHFDSQSKQGMNMHRAAPLSPGFRSKIGQFPSLRKNRIGGQERLRGLLIDADPEAASDGIPNQAEPERKPRNLLAAMQGNAHLMSDNFETEFQNGYCIGFRTKTDWISLRCEPGAELRFSHSRKSFETESAVSFETDQTRGMRQSLRFVHPDCKFAGRSVVDYLIADRSPYLLIDFSIRHPWFEKETRLESLTPLRFSLDLPENCASLELERRHSDGSVIVSSFDLTSDTKDNPTVRAAKNLIGQLLHRGKDGESRPYFLPGSRWILRWKDKDKDRGLVISLPDFENGIGLPLELLVERGEKPRVHLMPEGSYRDIGSGELVGLSQHLALALYPMFEPAAEVPSLDNFAERELSPSYIIRQR